MSGKNAEADRIEQRFVLQRISRGARLYVADQPSGRDSDMYTWTASLTSASRDRGGRQVMGRDLKAMQERHWIAYDRALDEFILTDDGRAVANEAESKT